MGARLVTCGCGREYDRRAWRALPLCGIQEFASDPDDPEPPLEPLELRNCLCGSTRGVPLSDSTRPSTVPPPLVLP